MATNLDYQSKKKDIFEKLSSGKIKLYQLDDLVGLDLATRIRREFVESQLDLCLENIGNFCLDPKTCTANIENMIGTVQVPLAIVGPVKIVGEYATGNFYLPLATTEGALAASVNRGCSVINKSGGAQVVVLKDFQTRSILFKVNSIVEAKRFCIWVYENFEDLKKVGEQDEDFIRVEKINPYVVGLNVWLQLEANTGDAMGMNMITIAGKKIVEYIVSVFRGVEFISESGNMCVDKKPSAMNLINGRGKKVVASVMISKEIVENNLKTTVDCLVDLNYRKNILGSASAGSLGYNAHFANIIAAMFIAMGQDVAHVVDGSHGFTTVEKSGKNVLFSVTLPALQVGVIGGGTVLATQNECLRILGVHAPIKETGYNSKKLAEIIAVGVLAGELSLIGALCSHDLARSHKRLNR
ncbi:hydroxymethylglutaryl-CoA reductase (NADPH) [bacterium]|jgi:hydroxymethylglutaryl-CoA reductase (NADPH)|nr:hydroxymethylglutaryl-CoA reductase (NADPH) [bacterium]